MAEEEQQKLLMTETARLKKDIKQKEEKLRKLKMAEIYRKKVIMINISLCLFSIVIFYSIKRGTPLARADLQWALHTESCTQNMK